jgi:hypothetical protein
MFKTRFYLPLVMMVFSLIMTSPAARAADVPDLSLEKLTVAPNPLTSGETATLTVEVKNIGKAKNRAVPLFFHGDEKALQAFGIPMQNSAEHGVPLPELTPGQVYNYTATKKITLTPGNYTIRAIIWPGNKPQVAAPMPNAEGNLSNNEREVQFLVKAGSVQVPGSGGLVPLPPEKYKLIEPKKIGPPPPDPLKTGPGLQTMPSGR